jgi:hypothetical protein
MAKLNEQTIVITISKMVPNSAPGGDQILLAASELLNLEAVVKELVGKECMVEILDNPK